MSDLTEAQRQRLFETLVSEEVERLRRADKGLRGASDAEVRRMARHNLAREYQALVREMARHGLNSQRSTVGCLYGKTRAQILKMNEDEE